jgi:hypothetical protein
VPATRMETKLDGFMGVPEGQASVPPATTTTTTTMLRGFPHVPSLSMGSLGGPCTGAACYSCQMLVGSHLVFLLPWDTFFFFLNKLPVPSVNSHPLVFRSNCLRTLSDTGNFAICLTSWHRATDPTSWGLNVTVPQHLREEIVSAVRTFRLEV